MAEIIIDNDKHPLGIRDEDSITITSSNVKISETTESKEGSKDKCEEEAANSNSKGQESLEEDVVAALRVQLEYYFSFENLSKDTFLCSVMSSSRTEMEQRSGSEYGRHAPIVILARFGKVKKIVYEYFSAEESSSLEASVQNYLQQAALSSATLEVVALDGSTLLGIGPKIGLPLPYESNFCVQQTSDGPPLPPPLAAASAPKQAERNTIILRDMPATATQQQVEAVFSWDGCIQVKSVTDFGNCWFVTFQGSEDEVVTVLLKLRNMKFEGESIKARLKPESSVKSIYSVSTLPSHTPLQPDAKSFSSHNPNPDIAPSHKNTHSKASSSHKSKAAIPNRNGANGRNNSGRYSAFDRSSRSRPYARPRSPPHKSNHTTSKDIASTPPPPLLDSHFPSLLSDNEKSAAPTALVDVENSQEKHRTDDSKDSNAVVTGYAAALLKTAASNSTAPIPAPPVAQKKPSSTTTVATKDFKKHTIKSTDRISTPNNHNARSTNKTFDKTNIPHKSIPTTKLETRATLTAQDDGSNRTATTDEKSSISSSQSDNKPIIVSNNKNDTAKTSSPVSSILWGGKKSFVDVLKAKQQDAAASNKPASMEVRAKN